MLSARILASGNYYQPLQPMQTLPSLTQALAEVCRHRYRRLDRFVQLAMVGAGRCAAVEAPDARCSLYLGSSQGPLSSNIQVQEAVVAQGELPAPFAFVNTLGSSAGFYVADNLGLQTSAVCIGRTHAGLEAAMIPALVDLETGVVEQALVGVVEEAALPLDAHRKRLGVAHDRELAEGSHWWLLQRAAADAVGPRIEWHADLDIAALAGVLDRRQATAIPLCMGQTLATDAIASVRAGFAQAETSATLAYHASVDAAWLALRKDTCAVVTPGPETMLNLLFHRGAQAPIHGRFLIGDIP